MNPVLKKNWPSNVSKKLSYRLGEKPLHEYLVQNAIDNPDNTSYEYYGNSLSWKELSNKTKRFAQYLRKLGIKKGDRIALFMQNCPQYVIGHYAIQMIGAIVIPLNPMYKGPELEYLINEAQIKVIISAQELYTELECIRQSLISLQFIITTNYADLLSDKQNLILPDELKIKKELYVDTLDMKEGIEQNNPIEELEEINLWKDIGLMVFTSGTTGRPKAAKLTYGNALFKTAAASQGYSINKNDITLALAPLCHIAGMVMGLNIPIYSAHKCILLTRFVPETAVTAIEKYKVNKIYTIAPMNIAILNHQGIENRNLTSLKINMATSFGVSIDKNLAEKWKKLTQGCLLFEASYGLSETHTFDTMMPIDKIKYGTCGIATFDTDIRIVDIDTKEDLSTGEQGEIVVRNPGVFKGYLNRNSATKKVLKEGWIFTGDIGKIDDDGYLYFEGRVKEMIKSSGYSVFPEDVESLLSMHDAVAEVAVIGVPDNVKGEIIKAFIVLIPKYKGKINENELIEWSKGQMASFKYPREIEFLDKLPTTSSGKVLRRLLKKK